MQLDHLNSSQREAVLCTEGPLLVLAGAGSGKTRVITHRVEYLLERGVAPESIVAITFTNKAAEEMRERLRQMVGKKRSEALVMGTFHALGVRMMREAPGDFDVPKRFSILDQGDVYGIVRSLLYEHGIHGKGNDRRFDAGAIVQRISLWKNEFLTGTKAKALAQSPGASEYDEIAAQIFDDYNERLHNLGSLDFDDLVCRIATCLRDNAEAKARWTERYRYVLVDEYQDTNPAQFEMIRGMLCPRENLCVVGDDDQAIYGWRGAKVANILGFDMYFPKAKIIKLEENYRCRPDIVACANTVIANNTSRYNKQLLAQRSPGEQVTVVECSDDHQECKWVSGKIRELVMDDRKNPGDIAVLYRSTRQVKEVQARLEEHGVAYQVLGGQTFFDRKEVKDVSSYLKVLVTPKDDLATRRALDNPSRGIGKKTLERLLAFADEHNTSLMHAVHHANEVEGISSRPLQALEMFSKSIRRSQQRLHAGQPASHVLRDLVSEVGLREALKNATGSAETTANRWANVEWLFRSIDRFEQKPLPPGQRRNWLEFVRAIDSPREDDSSAIDGVVTLATMHSAKGLEWPYVFIIGAEEGILPHKRVDSPRISDAIAGDVEEERRLFYVAITRARDALWITRAKVRHDRGREIETKPSRFLLELPDANIRPYNVQSEEKLTHDQIDAMAEAFLAKLGAS